MAITHLFDTKYYAQQNGSEQDCGYRLIIGDSTGAVTSAVSGMTLADPGIRLNWQGDENMSTSVIGSSLSFTAILDDDQMDTLESMMDTNEGDIFCLFFNGVESDTMPYWYGHLLKESVSIRIGHEIHFVDMDFTDGLGSLKGKVWADEDGDFYVGFKKLSFYIREVVSKLPAYEPYRDYVTNNGETYVPVFKTVAWPQPWTEFNDAIETWSGNYGHQNPVADNSRVRAQTFNKPKKNVNRLRELEAPPEYMNAFDVLEDICKCFGATAMLCEGYLHLTCRLDLNVQSLEEVNSFVRSHAFDYRAFNDTWDITYLSRRYLATDVDEKYEALSGATKGYSVPTSQVNITHEEGGSDALVMEGYYVNSGGAINALDTSDSLVQSLVATSSNGSGDGAFNGLYATGVRRDIMYRFGNASQYADVDLGFFIQPANPTDYMGFPPAAVTDMEFQSGEQVRVQFGGNFRLDVGPLLESISYSALYRIHVGAVVVIRLRLQFVTNDNVGYRLSRTVHTHAATSGDLDFITIDNVRIYYNPTSGEVQFEDRVFFRKLYNDIDWVRDDHEDYDDSWFEIIVPHGDNENSGEDYGAPITQLTELYDGQPSYAPIGTQLQGDNDGAGVILEGEYESTLMQYFQEDFTVPLPYGDANEQVVLDFERFYFEMGAAEYEHDAGPRGNAEATGLWLGDLPLWKSADASGAGGFVRYSGAGAVAWPEFFHFTGLKISMGDGTENSDLTTKVTGGDGYEVVNLGSTRLGSRSAFANTHVGGTIWVNKMEGAAPSDPPDYTERLAWAGHFASLGAISNEIWDSLHRYYGDAYMQQFGKSVEIINTTLMPVSGRSLGVPFEVFKTTLFSRSSNSVSYLTPLRYNWTMNDGIQGVFLKVSESRDLSTIQNDEGRPLRGPGGIIGSPPGVNLIQQLPQTRDDIATNTQDITSLNDAKNDLEAQSYYLER